MKLYPPFPFRAIDDLLVPYESVQWRHIRWDIEGNLVWLDEEKGNIRQEELPYIYAFEDEVKHKLIKAGFKKDLWENQANFQIVLHELDSKDGKTFLIKPDIAASLRTLNSIMILKQLLLKDGIVNKEAVKVYLRSFELAINLLRSGSLTGKVKGGKQREAQLSAPREKKNKALLKYCGDLMKAKPSSSAETLFRHIPKKEKAEIVDGFTFYRDDPDGKGEEKIYCIDATGKVERTVGSRPFSDYYKAAAKKLER